MVTDGIGSPPGGAGERMSLAERSLARAQQLVDRKPAGQAALPWYVEAMHVGDLSLLALLLQRPPPSDEEALRSPEARRQMAFDEWLRDQGLSAADPEAVMWRMDEVGPEELERMLRGYEERLGKRPGSEGTAS